MPLLIIPLLWIAAVVGRRIFLRVLGPASSTSTATERTLLGTATGLVVMAYGMLVLGLVGYFNIRYTSCWVAILAIAGGREHISLGRDIASAKRFSFSIFSLTVIVLCAVFALFAIVGCLTPPYPLEWDSLSYHLADPRIYVRHGKIVPLPWESHSNFAFTMEMLYSIGLMLHSTALAKLFHFSMAFIAALGIWQIGRRHLDARTGAVAALIFASMPLVFWEAGTAYVDLAATAFGVLAFLALLNAMKLNEDRWLWVMTLMLGGMISIKATSAITTLLYATVAASWLWRQAQAGGVAKRHATVKAVKGMAIIGVVAALIGSPWYIKSWAMTGNPVYPFAYSVFGGRHWSADNSKLYTRDQQSFGIGHEAGGTRLPLLADIMIAPWAVTMFTMPGHPPPAGSKINPFNDIPSGLVSLTPMLLVGMFGGFFLRRRLPIAVTSSLGVSAALLLFWAPATQQERYLFPIYPLLCLVAAYFTLELLAQRRIAGYALAVLCAVSVIQSIAIGQAAARSVAPVALGHEPKSAFLERAFRTYRAFEYINSQPPGSGVVMYGEPLGFYCDQPYMWGEPTHGRVIPYDLLTTPEDLRRYLLSHGYRYILVNTSGAALPTLAPGAVARGWDEKVGVLTSGIPVYDNGRTNGAIRVYSIQ